MLQLLITRAKIMCLAYHLLIKVKVSLAVSDNFNAGSLKLDQWFKLEWQAAHSNPPSPLQKRHLGAWQLLWNAEHMFVQYPLLRLNQTASQISEKLAGCKWDLKRQELFDRAKYKWFVQEHTKFDGVTQIRSKVARL